MRGENASAMLRGARQRNRFESFQTRGVIWNPGANDDAWPWTPDRPSAVWNDSNGGLNSPYPTLFRPNALNPNEIAQINPTDLRFAYDASRSDMGGFRSAPNL